MPWHGAIRRQEAKMAMAEGWYFLIGLVLGLGYQGGFTFINRLTALYDIGTKNAFETCFSHNSTQIAPPELAFSQDCSTFCVGSESASHNVLKCNLFSENCMLV